MKDRLYLLTFFMAMILFDCGSNSGPKPIITTDLQIRDLTVELNDDGDDYDPCADQLTYRITFKTTLSTKAVLYWGESSLNPVNQENSTSAFKTQHTFNLYPINPDIDFYYYRIIVYTADNDSLKSDPDSFKPTRGPSVMPTFVSLKTIPSAEFVLIYFKLSHAAKAEIRYGLTSGYGKTYAISEAKTTHYIRIDSLLSDTLYHYTIGLEDNCGNINAGAWDSTFRTNPLPLIYFKPDTITTTGTDVSIPVYVENIIDLFAVKFQFSFPTDILSYDYMEKGDLFLTSKYNGIQCLEWPSPADANYGKTAGNVTTWTQILEEYIYPVGSYMKLPLRTPGHIATFHFKVIGKGDGKLEFKQTELDFLDCQRVHIDCNSLDGHLYSK